jgi:hypothetical protein
MARRLGGAPAAGRRSLGSPLRRGLIACFSAGAILGMALLAGVIALRCRAASCRAHAGVLARAHTVLEAVVGCAAIGIGVWVLYTATGSS